MRDESAATNARHVRLVLAVAAAMVLAACSGGGGGGGGDGGTGGGDPPPPPPPPPSGGTKVIPRQTVSSTTAYVTPTAAGWEVVPLVTVGDSPAGATYPLVGKPDGLGAIAGRLSDAGEIADTSQYMTVLVNHEIRGDQGVPRAHGTRGAFVSQWTFELETLRAVAGRDLANRAFASSGGAWTEATGSLTFDRLCSADLAPRSAFYNSATGNGYDGRLFTNGEEVADSGRAFAWIVGGPEHGRAYQLPFLGQMAFENVVASPHSGDATVAVMLDDIALGQVYVYVGQKARTGTPVERAGLHGGKLYGVRVTDGGANYPAGPVAIENRGAVDGRFELVDVSDAALGSGTQLQSVSVQRGLTQFARPEDGAWHLGDGRVFYWATTGAVLNGVRHPARLYRLTFDSASAPTGGEIDLIVDSSALTGLDGRTADGFDNMTVNGDGRIVLQEDGGNDAYVSKVWLVDPSSGSATQILESDRARFASGGAQFMTDDEENSGVIEITDIVRSASWYDAGRRYYLGTNQAHRRHATTSLVEEGQLYLFASPK